MSQPLKSVAENTRRLQLGPRQHVIEGSSPTSGRIYFQPGEEATVKSATSVIYFTSRQGYLHLLRKERLSLQPKWCGAID